MPDGSRLETNNYLPKFWQPKPQRNRAAQYALTCSPPALSGDYKDDFCPVGL